MPSQSGLDDHYKITGLGNFSKSFKYLIYALIEAKQLTLRMLSQLKVIKLPDYHFKTFNSSDISIPASLYPFLILIDYLKNLFPDIESVELKLELLSSKFNEDYSIYDTTYENDNASEYLISIALPFLIEEKLLFDTNHKERTAHTLPFNNNYIHCYINEQRFTNYRITINDVDLSKITASRDSDSEVKKINVFECLNAALKNCLKRGYIK